MVILNIEWEDYDPDDERSWFMIRKINGELKQLLSCYAIEYNIILPKYNTEAWNNIMEWAETPQYKKKNQKWEDVQENENEETVKGED